MWPIDRPDKAAADGSTRLASGAASRHTRHWLSVVLLSTAGCAVTSSDTPFLERFSGRDATTIHHDRAAANPSHSESKTASGSVADGPFADDLVAVSPLEPAERSTPENLNTTRQPAPVATRRPILNRLLDDRRKPRNVTTKSTNRGRPSDAIPGSPEEIIESIREQVADGHSDDAIRLLDQSLRAAPDLPGGYELLVEIDAQNPRGDAAFRVLQEAVVRRSRDGNLAFLMGVALERRGRWEEARIHLEQAHQLLPDDAAVTMEFAGVLLAVQRGDLARQVLESGAARHDDSDVYTALGDLYSAEGRHHDAIRIYERSLAADPQNANLRYNLAFAYYHARRYEPAIAQFARLHQQGELFDTSSLLACGDALMQTGRLVEARETYELAVANQRDNFDAQLAVGFCSWAMGDDTSAFAIGRQVAHSDPNRIDAYRLQGMASFRSGDHPLAFQLFDRALRLDTQDPVTYLLLGVALERLGASAEALVYSRRAEELAPQDPVARSRTRDLETQLAGRERLLR